LTFTTDKQAQRAHAKQNLFACFFQLKQSFRKNNRAHLLYNSIILLKLIVKHGVFSFILKQTNDLVLHDRISTSVPTACLQSVITKQVLCLNELLSICSAQCLPTGKSGLEAGHGQAAGSMPAKQGATNRAVKKHEPSEKIINLNSYHGISWNAGQWPARCFLETLREGPAIASQDRSSRLAMDGGFPQGAWAVFYFGTVAG
jgi:hypothetical protein